MTARGFSSRANLAAPESWNRGALFSKDDRIAPVERCEEARLMMGPNAKPAFAPAGPARLKTEFL
ncbi:MAG: hypothetical protein WC076_12465 [Terrimicrobiaceae bacterium]